MITWVLVILFFNGVGPSMAAATVTGYTNLETCQIAAMQVVSEAPKYTSIKAFCIRGSEAKAAEEK